MHQIVRERLLHYMAFGQAMFGAEVLERFVKRHGQADSQCHRIRVIQILNRYLMGL